MKDPKDYFSYDSETGIITRTILHFNCKKAICDYINKDGYIYISFDNKKLKGHRLAWYLYYGEWPKYDIDHINHNKSDNRICNLRDVPESINCKNLSLQKNNKSGYPGVIWRKSINKWEVRIGGTKNRIHIGVFENLEDAIKAKIEMENKLQYHENHCKGGDV